MSDTSAEGMNVLFRDLEENMAPPPPAPTQALTGMEKDALGEIGNISMGTAATTMYTLIGRRVSITTPRVSIMTAYESFKEYKKPYVAVRVSYTQGLDGHNLLLMKQEDAALISNLLLGESTEIDPAQELNEIQISAVSEVMNQMVGSSATAMADILGRTVSIAPPEVNIITLASTNVAEILENDEDVIKISFTMEIEGLLMSEIMQIMPFSVGRALANGLMAPEPQKPAQAPPMPPAPQKAATPAPAASEGEKRIAAAETNKKVNVKSVQYQSFDNAARDNGRAGGDNLEIIADVPLQVTVELGKCKKSVKEIMGFTIGTVIVLNRLAGELVDVLVNGRLLARGEVVVIDDSYGVRITEIISPRKQGGE